MPRARDPIYREHFMAVGKLRWRCNICIGSRGGRGRAMTRKQAMFHEVSRKHSLMVAATFFKHPEIFKLSIDNGKWLCQICQADAMTVKKAVAHEVWCQRRSSMHQEGTIFERNDDNDDDDDDDDNNNDDNDDNDNDDAAFVENFLWCHDVDASRRERMRSFYKMPTDQKIQTIQEVINVIRDLRGQ